MPAEAASEQACAMEHSLTDEAMVRMVRFFEFLGACPSVTESFRQCPMVQDRKSTAHVRMPQTAERRPRPDFTGPAAMASVDRRTLSF